jgi:hypothetical protein
MAPPPASLKENSLESDATEWSQAKATLLGGIVVARTYTGDWWNLDSEDDTNAFHPCDTLE